MPTACWATNEDFDCAWVNFGYGSQWDLSKLWLSLRGLLALAEYDYHFDPLWQFSMFSGDLDSRIIAEQLQIPLDHKRNYILNMQEYEKIPLLYQYKKNHVISINHPEGIEKSIEWFTAWRSVVGKHSKNGGEGDMICYSIPSVDDIEKINKTHAEWFKNVKDRLDNYLDYWSPFNHDDSDCVTEQEMEDMFKGWEKEAEENTQLGLDILKIRF